MADKYKVRFLPLFEKDLSDAVDYICNELQNPTAAANLIDAVEDAITERSSCAESFEPYESLRDRQHTYYRIYVGNFIVFYVAIDDIMEVRRFIYNKRDLKKHI